MTRSGEDAETVLRGTVVGETGTPVAGWVSLGKKQPQRWLKHELQILDTDGNKVTIEGLGANTIVPVSVREVAWREIESDALAKLCTREAPAPDVEVDFTSAVLRGGDSVVVAGTVSGRGYVGGESQRGSVEGGITKLRAEVIACGEDRDDAFAKAQDRRAELRKKQERDAAAKPAKAKGKGKGKEKAGVSNASAFRKREIDYPMILTFGGLAVVAGAAAVFGDHGRWLLVAACVAWCLRACNAMLLAPMRTGHLAPMSLEVPFGAYVIGASLAVFLQFASYSKRTDPAKLIYIGIILIVFTSVLAAVTLWLTLATRKRLRYLKILASAPPHPDPAPDGVWGASTGAFTSKALYIGKEHTASGSGKHVIVRSNAFANVQPEATLLRPGTSSSLNVRLAEAAIMTLARFKEDSGPRAEKRGELIGAGTPVIAAGRATDGVLRKGGEASLIVFACDFRRDVQHELRRVIRREQIADVLTIVGTACAAAGLIIGIR